jgi:hypothetical protein
MDLNFMNILLYFFRASNFAMNGNGNIPASMVGCDDQQNCLVVMTF